MRGRCECGEHIRSLIYLSSKNFPVTCPNCGLRQYLLRSWSFAWSRFLILIGIPVIIAAFLLENGEYFAPTLAFLLFPFVLIFIGESFFETPEFESQVSRSRRLHQRDYLLLVTVLLLLGIVLVSG